MPLLFANPPKTGFFASRPIYADNLYKHSVGPDLDPNCLNSNRVTEIMFEKVNFEKSQQTTKA